MKRMSFHGSRKELSDCIVDKAKDYIQNNTSHHPGASSLTLLLDIFDDIERACEKCNTYNEDKYDAVLIDFIHFVSLNLTSNKTIEVVNCFRIIDIIFMKNGTKKNLKLLEDKTQFFKEMVHGATKLARRNNTFERTIVFDMLSMWLSNFAERQLEFPKMYNALFKLRLKFPFLFRVARNEGPPLFMDDRAVQERQIQKNERENLTATSAAEISSVATPAFSKGNKSDVVDDLLDLSFDDNATTTTGTTTLRNSKEEEMKDFSLFIEASDVSDTPPPYPPPKVPSSLPTGESVRKSSFSSTKNTSYNPFDHFK